MTSGTAVVAVGGNSLIVDPAHESIPDQAAAATAHHIAEMVAAGWNVVITHGSGLQMGFILRRSASRSRSAISITPSSLEARKGRVPRQPHGVQAGSSATMCHSGGRSGCANQAKEDT